MFQAPLTKNCSEPAAWRDGLDGWPRLRVIVNAMTRMRFCSPAGEMEFRSKGKAAAPPISGLLTADFYGLYIEQAVEAGLVRMRSEGR